MPFHQVVENFLTTTDVVDTEMNKRQQKLVENDNYLKAQIESNDADILELQREKVDDTTYQEDKEAQATKDEEQIAEIEKLKSGKLNSATFTAYKAEQATKDTQQDIEISSLKTTKVDSSTFTSYKEEQAAKDLAQDQVLEDYKLNQLEKNIEQDQAIANKATLGGIPANFNLCGITVAQDGLVSNELPIDTSKDFCLIGDFVLGSTLSVFSIGGSKLGGIQIAQVGEKLTLRESDGDSYFNVVSTLTAIQGEKYQISLIKIGNKCTIAVNGIAFNGVLNKIKHVNMKPSTNYIDYFLIYNRALTQQEIQYNFYVLNNSQSINKIETTNLNGDKKQFLLGSDSDNVLTRTGHTDEERYTELLKTTCKEFVSADGSDIVVPNGIGKQRVLGLEMQGRTVKNLNTDMRTFIFPRSLSIAPIQVTGFKKYLIILDIFDFVTNGNIRPVFRKLNGQFVYATAPSYFAINGNGITSMVFTAPADADNLSGFNFSSDEGADCKFKILAIIESDIELNILKQLPFGLSSTEAITSNNGVKQAFHHQYIKGETKVIDEKLVSLKPSVEGLPELGSTPTSEDTIDLVTGEMILNTKEIVLNGSESWVIQNEATLSNTLLFQHTGADSMVTSLPISDKFSEIEYAKMWTVDTEGIGNGTTSIRIRISKSKLTTQDAPGFKAWLQSNHVAVRYQLVTPIKRQLTTEELQVYKVYKKLISLGSVGNVRDTLTITGNGNVVFIDNTNKYIENGDGNWVVGTLPNSEFHIYKRINRSPHSPVLADRVGAINVENSTVEAISYYPYYYNDAITYFPSNGITTKEEAISRLKANPITFEYQLATPVVETIDKRVNEPIPTYEQNSFSFGGDIKPSSAKISVPIDRLTPIEQELAQIKAMLQSPGNLSLHANYVEDEYNKNLQEERML